MRKNLGKRLKLAAFGNPLATAAVVGIWWLLVAAFRELLSSRAVEAGNQALDQVAKPGTFAWLVGPGMWVLFLGLTIALIAASVWLGIRLGKYGFGRRYCISALDDLYADGVSQRNNLQSRLPDYDFKEVHAAFVQWNNDVIQILGQLSIRERAWFRTLNTFTWKYVVSQGVNDPRYKFAQAMWNEKLDRLNTIIARIEE